MTETGIRARLNHIKTTTMQNIKHQLEVIEIELVGIIAITRKPNLLFREVAEKRIAHLMAVKNELLKQLKPC
jgi:hypothetical protein